MDGGSCQESEARFAGCVEALGAVLGHADRPQPMDDYWSDAALLDKVRELVLPVVDRSGPIEAWIIDDTGFSQEGTALGRGDPAILRSARQAGQLSGGGVAVAGQP